MKNLLVTGGCGFIGSNFIRFLFKDAGFRGRVINVDKLTYAGNPENLSDIEKRYKKRYRFIRADICNRKVMDGIFKEFQIDSICHFAAETHVDRAIYSSSSFIRTNVLGTHVLLELTRKYMERIKLFHHISTDEVYGSLGARGYFREDSPYRPNNPYSATKAGSDHLVRAYHRTYGIPVTISNCSNNYGPYQFPEKFIPLMILNAIEGKPLPVYGDGKHIRDWLYVKDHCIAIWKIMNEGRVGETYTIGGGAEIQNITLAETICDLVDELTGQKGKSRELITFVKDRPGHDRRYAMDFSKLRSQLGWEPKEDINSGLRKTIRWYMDNMDWVNRVRKGDYRKWIRLHYGDRLKQRG